MLIVAAGCMPTTELLQSYSGTTVQGNHFIHSCQTKNIELDFLEKYLKKVNDALVTGSIVSYTSSKKVVSYAATIAAGQTIL